MQGAMCWAGRVLAWGRAGPSGPRARLVVASVVVLSDKKCYGRDEYYDWGVTSSVTEEGWMGASGRGED